MPDEPIPENTEPPVPTPEPEPAPASVPFPGQQPLPHMPAWVTERLRNESTTCQYKCDPPCLNKVDPINGLKDVDTGLVLCPTHAKACADCNKVHVFDDLHEINGIYFCEDCFNENYSTCQNCHTIVENDEILLPTRRNNYYMKSGGCTECATTCTSCSRIIDKDNSYNADGDDYCEDCYSEHFTSCEECGDAVDRDSSNYVEDVGDFCNHCYNKRFTQCEGCTTIIEKSDASEIDGNDYCQTCFDEKGPGGYAEYTEKFEGFSYTKKDRYLNLLYKILPITIKDLKTKQPSLAGGLADLISFSKGKPLTKEIVDEYRASLTPEEFPIEYTVWDGGQRSIDRISNYQSKPQLVLNIIASSQMLAKLQANPILYNLFEKCNELSKKSGHPFKEDQIGWARLEIQSKEEASVYNGKELVTEQKLPYILVDEIQSDHSNIINRLRNPSNDLEAKKIHSALKEKYSLDDEQMEKLLAEYWAVVKDFPNIASQSVVRFAQQNGIKKLFWHTYESGKALKRNEPPKSLYDKTPKENFFLPSSEQPFGLEGKFFEKEAKAANNMYKLARKLYFRNLNKIF